MSLPANSLKSVFNLLLLWQFMLIYRKQKSVCDMEKAGDSLKKSVGGFVEAWVGMIMLRGGENRNILDDD